jgi:hypothetical protein
VTPAEIEWGPTPVVLPAAIQDAALYSDQIAPGVLAIITHHNIPRMKPLPWSYLPVQDDKAVELPQRMWPLS